MSARIVGTKLDPQVDYLWLGALAVVDLELDEAWRVEMCGSAPAAGLDAGDKLAVARWREMAAPPRERQLERGVGGLVAG